MGTLTGKGKHTVKEGNHPYTNMISKVTGREIKLQMQDM